jgi:hypothetical protein
MIIRSDPNGHCLGFYKGDGTPIASYEYGNDLVSFLKRLGEVVGFEVDYQGEMSQEEYERDWC